MSEWQPIETAPKDGSLVLLIVKGFTPFVGRWLHDEEEFCYVDAEDYAEESHYRAVMDDWIWEPTHWMLLPEPPK